MSAICPGQQTLFSGEQPHYLCVFVTVYYTDSPANDDEFILHNYSLRPMNLTTRTALCAEILARLRLYQGQARVMRVIYRGYEGLELCDSEVEAYGWRFIDGSQPLYVPGTNPNPQPAPAPAPEPAPTPAAAEAPEPMPEDSIEARLNAGSTKR